VNFPGSRQVSQADIIDQIPIKFYDTNNTILQTGVLFTTTDSVKILYDDNKIRELTDLLVLSADKSGQKTISAGGNSGSIVFDGKGFAIGMIVSGDDKYTYAIKLSNFFDLHTEMKIIN
jgi:hypothetical protein